MKVKIDKKRKIYIVLTIISICVIVVIGIFYPLIVYTIIPNGTKESTVRFYMGIPVGEHDGISGPTMLTGDFPPNIPYGIKFRSYRYSSLNQWLYIIFISPSDYSNVTGSIVISNDWLVIYKDTDTKAPHQH